MSCGKKRNPSTEGFHNVASRQESDMQEESVCDNQDNFNQAVQEAVKYNNNEVMKKSQPWAQICSIVWLIFFVWAVVLAMKVPVGPRRVEHIMFAILFSPAYVIAYYLAPFGSGGGMMGGSQSSRMALA
jgi:uncharacterized membrane protein (DUF106 family)